MNNINEINIGNFNWNAIVDKINDASTLTNIKEASFDVSSGNVTFSVGEGDTASKITLNVPDLDTPGAIDQTEFASLVDKLGTNGTFNLTDEQIEELQGAINVMSNVELSQTSGSILFDLYALMALMLEAAQKQRDAAREIRSAENEAQQQAIQNQAEAQRNAALTGMIAGLVVCAVQVVAQGVAIYKSASAHGMQKSAMTESDVGALQKQADASKATFETETGKLAEMKAKTSPPATPEQLAEQKQVVADAKEQMEYDMRMADSAEHTLQSDDRFVRGRYQQEKWHNIGDLFNAIGNTLQSTVRGVADLLQAEATEMGAEQKIAEEEHNLIKDLFDQEKEVINSVLQLFRAVLQAESQSMRDAIQA